MTTTTDSDLTWERITAQLESERDRIIAEIGRYPTPITACDAHFNQLLVERAQIFAELNRLQKISMRRDADALDEFIRSSGFLLQSKS
jgi:hypothetical protein